MTRPAGSRRIKEAAGRAAGDEELETQGQADQGEGNLRQAGDKAKDASKKVRQIARPVRSRGAGGQVFLTGPVPPWPGCPGRPGS